MLKKIFNFIDKVFMDEGGDSETTLGAYNNAKRFYEVIFLSIQSIAILAAIQIANKKIDSQIMTVLYILGCFAWFLYLFCAIKYFFYATLEKMSGVTRKTRRVGYILSFLFVVMGMLIAIWAPIFIAESIRTGFVSH